MREESSTSPPLTGVSRLRLRNTAWQAVPWCRCSYILAAFSFYYPLALLLCHSSF